MKKIINRLNRVSGQVLKVNDAIDSEEDCNKVIPQLLAVKGAVDGIVREYLEQTLEACASEKRSEDMKQIIKMIMKHT